MPGSQGPDTCARRSVCRYAAGGAARSPLEASDAPQNRNSPYRPFSTLACIDEQDDGWLHLPLAYPNCQHLRHENFLTLPKSSHLISLSSSNICHTRHLSIPGQRFLVRGPSTRAVARRQTCVQPSPRAASPSSRGVGCRKGKARKVGPCVDAACCSCSVQGPLLLTNRREKGIPTGWERRHGRAFDAWVWCVGLSHVPRECINPG